MALNLENDKLELLFLEMIKRFPKMIALKLWDVWSMFCGRRFIRTCVDALGTLIDGGVDVFLITV